MQRFYLRTGKFGKKYFILMFFVQSCYAVGYQENNHHPVFSELCRTLDNAHIEPNTKLEPIFKGIDAQTSSEDFHSVMAQLLPAGVNGSAFASARFMHTQPLDRIMGRLEAFRLGVNTFRAKTGYAAGDMLEDMGSYGPMLLGNVMRQADRDGILGFTATTGGFGFLGDVPIDRCRVGWAVSYANGAVKQNGRTGNNTVIDNIQGAIYGSTQYGPLFFDGVVALGVNRYTGKRNLIFLQQPLTATAKYNGTQYTGKVRGGFTIPVSSLEISPLATLQYSHLNQGAYMETGAPGANLSVSATQANVLQLGLGARVADISQGDDFLPEIHVLYLVDSKSPNLRVTSQFIDGGGSFITTAPPAPKSGVNVGGSLAMMMSDQLLIFGSYDLEAKKSFISQSVALKFKYLF